MDGLHCVIAGGYADRRVEKPMVLTAAG
jgi:hypothetical protein